MQMLSKCNSTKIANNFKHGGKYKYDRFLKNDFVNEIIYKYTYNQAIEQLNDYIEYYNFCIENLQDNPYHLHNKFQENDTIDDIIKTKKNDAGDFIEIQIQDYYSEGFIGEPQPNDTNFVKYPRYFRLWINNNNSWNFTYSSDDTCQSTTKQYVDNYCNFLIFKNDLDNESDDISKNNSNSIIYSKKYND